MITTIDEERGEVIVKNGETEVRHSLASAEGFAAQRARLGLSQVQMAQLLGASALSVYKWESGKAHPRAAQLERIASIRQLGKREALARLTAGQGG